MVKNLPSNVGDLGSIPGRGTKLRLRCSKINKYLKKKKKIAESVFKLWSI